MIIIPSLLATTQDELDKRCAKVSSHFSAFHLDVMDGIFVPQKSLDFDFQLQKAESVAHLMLLDPSRWIQKHLEKVAGVFVHVESDCDIKQVIEYVHSKGKTIGLALNPETTVDVVLPFLDIIDSVLVMTVHPGKYGALFLPEMTLKIKKLRSLRSDLVIIADGGMTPNTIASVVAAGTTHCVVGSYLQNAENLERALKRVRF